MAPHVKRRLVVCRAIGEDLKLGQPFIVPSAIGVSIPVRAATTHRTLVGTARNAWCSLQRSAHERLWHAEGSHRRLIRWLFAGCLVGAIDLDESTWLHLHRGEWNVSARTNAERCSPGSGLALPYHPPTYATRAWAWTQVLQAPGKLWHLPLSHRSLERRVPGKD